MTARRRMAAWRRMVPAGFSPVPAADCMAAWRRMVPAGCSPVPAADCMQRCQLCRRIPNTMHTTIHNTGHVAMHTTVHTTAHDASHIDPRQLSDSSIIVGYKGMCRQQWQQVAICAAPDHTNVHSRPHHAPACHPPGPAPCLNTQSTPHQVMRFPTC
eukprot:363747-Chlamydomonas_euryale.AAC.12